MKKVLIVILIIILAVFLVKIFSNEDDWICVDNDWVKHGVPLASKPTTPCGTIDSFEECIAAGFPAMESYPRQCRTSDDRTFVEQIIGGQRDEYGCLGPAGYTYNETIDSCVRQWELDERNYIENNEEECELVQFLCAGELIPFFDSTGCGCETESARQKDVCSKESRNAEACIEIYQPVCGWNDPEKIQCIKFPCANTYSNSCFACIDENVLYYTEGECPE